MTMQRDVAHERDERGVSPVIGVILMVAITVILAAVIAAFVLDLGQSVDGEATAGVEIDNDTVTVTTLSDADGVYIADDDGEPIESEDAVLTSTGASFSTNTSGDFAVVAFIGESDDPHENAETTTTIQTFEVE